MQPDIQLRMIFLAKTPTSTVTLQCIGDVDDTCNDRLIHYQ